MAIQVKFADPDYGNVLREVLVSDLGYDRTAVGTFFKGSAVDKDSFRSAFGKDPEIVAFQNQEKDAFTEIFEGAASLSSSPKDNKATIDRDFELIHAARKFVRLVGPSTARSSGSLDVLVEEAEMHVRRRLLKAKAPYDVGLRQDYADIRVKEVRFPHFLMWRNVDEDDIWENRWGSDDIFLFAGGAVLQGATLACVEEVIFDAPEYDRFISRVRKSDWVGEAQPAGVRDKSADVAGIIKGRDPLLDRMTVLRMTERVGADPEGKERRPGRLLITFDSYDAATSTDLNDDPPEGYTGSSLVTADNAGHWHLTQFGSGPTSGVRIGYQSAVDIHTLVPDPIVARYIPDDSRAVFRDMMKRIVQKCGLPASLTTP